MNLVEVKRISYYPPSKGYAVLLVEKDGDRSIRIMVGQAEAQAIVDTEIESAQAAYDALSAEDQANTGSRPAKYNLP